MIRTVRTDDLPALAVLNDAAVPAVNPLGLDGLAAHVPRCDTALVVPDDAGAPLAFLLALAPGAPYASENYRWSRSTGRARSTSTGSSSRRRRTAGAWDAPSTTPCCDARPPSGSARSPAR